MEKIKGRVFYSEKHDPTFNLAIEDYLLDIIEEDELILYLWQNEKTVVIGRNQNPWKECRLDLMKEEGIRLVRRGSGGGAVYHDLGNLNFTFVAKKKHYSVENQLSIILEAVRSFDIEADFSGRNDLLASGMKFSGNAFINEKKGSMHHGTLLVDVDMPSLGKYLSVSELKIKSKGVDSVKSRVVNLKALAEEMTIEMMKERVVSVFRERCDTDGMIHYAPDDKIDKSPYDQKKWIFSESPQFEISLEEKFDWGLIEISATVRDGVIKEAGVYTDALHVDGFKDFEGLMIGKAFDGITLSDLTEQVNLTNDIQTSLTTWLKRVV